MDQYQSLMQVVIKSKADSQSRHKQRKLEREVVSLTFYKYILSQNQYQAKQDIRDASHTQVCAIEEAEPSVFDELSLKRRWSSVCKDPERGLKAEKAATTLAAWPTVNHLNPSQGETIVNNKILQLDQESCKHILQAMLVDR